MTSIQLCILWLNDLNLNFHKLSSTMWIVAGFSGILLYKRSESLFSLSEYWVSGIAGLIYSAREGRAWLITLLPHFIGVQIRSNLKLPSVGLDPSETLGPFQCRLINERSFGYQPPFSRPRGQEWVKFNFQEYKTRFHFSLYLYGLNKNGRMREEGLPLE